MQAQVVARPTALSAATCPPYTVRKAIQGLCCKHALCSSQARLPAKAAADGERGRVREQRLCRLCIERGAVPTLSGVEGQGLCLQHALCSSEPASLLIPSGKQAASPSSTT